MLLNNESQPAATNVSLHHNFWINNYQRSPEVSTGGLVDIRNNVFWDWGARATRFNDGGRGNVINNVFDTSSNAEDAVVLESDAGPVYVHGNQGPGALNVNSLTTAAAAFNVAPVTTDVVTDVEDIVLQGVGAFPRDAVDTSLAGSTAPPPRCHQPRAKC